MPAVTATNRGLPRPRSPPAMRPPTTTWPDTAGDSRPSRWNGFLTFGSPLHALLNESGRAQLVVVGAHGRDSVGRAPLGDTCSALLPALDCPLLIAHRGTLPSRGRTPGLPRSRCRGHPREANRLPVGQCEHSTYTRQGRRRRKPVTISPADRSPRRGRTEVLCRGALAPGIRLPLAVVNGDFGFCAERRSA